MHSNNYDVIGIVNLDDYKDNFVDLYLAIKKLYRPAYEPNERILVTSTFDYYKQSHGLILQSLQTIVNHIDISNCFITFSTTNKNIHKEYAFVHKTYSTDSTLFDIESIDGVFKKLPAGNIVLCNSIDHGDRSKKYYQTTKRSFIRK